MYQVAAAFEAGYLAAHGRLVPEAAPELGVGK